MKKVIFLLFVLLTLGSICFVSYGYGETQTVSSINNLPYGWVVIDGPYANNTYTICNLNNAPYGAVVYTAFEPRTLPAGWYVTNVDYKYYTNEYTFTLSYR